MGLEAIKNDGQSNAASKRAKDWEDKSFELEYKQGVPLWKVDN